VINMKVEKGDYIHGYMLNSGYSKELADWSKSNTNERLHFFWDKKNASTTTTLTPQLTMHTLDDMLFVEYMAGCKGYATTAGFESVCEAMYLQKPVLMVPTHIEQECNALDALSSNAGVTAEHFDLNALLDFIPTYNKTLEFRYWMNTAESLFLHELTRVETEASNVLAAM